MTDAPHDPQATPPPEPTTAPADGQDGFIRLLLRHEPAVRAFLRPLLRGEGEVDEVLQRASVVAWEKFPTLRDPGAFASWLCVIARFEALRFRRDAARRPGRLGDAVLALLADEGLEELDDRERELAALDRCLKTLPDATRRAVLAAHRGGETVRATALALGASVEAMYKRVHRARLTLLRCVEAQLAAGAEG